MSITYGCVKLLDSLKFLIESLDGCASSLKDEDYVFLKEQVQENYHLFTKKLPYPYDYFEILEDYEKDINLLTEKDYYSKLNKMPSSIEIQKTNEIIKKLAIKNGRQLPEIYCKADIILLADIFENFIKNTYEEFKINPLYNISAPGLTWSAGLKYSKVKSERIQDIDLFKFLERGIRGEISTILGSRLIESCEKIKILYEDVSNLYGLAMMQFLPTDNVRVEKNNSIDTVLNDTDDSKKGNMVMVDLKYPDENKEHTKHYPLCPEHKNPPENYFQNI